ncbi:geranylgeranyl pyrophosphate synthase [Aspergillus brasiliensis]|uniref:Geranylgeranyl pyrophosphate synthase n=1 Tax=Aspergillus brasiliensis TaxID=319629 RepID=A0A9W5Z1X9_9EURO|nr:geranylgeranyl pyrophosphate synthase [Aspergillus brasiliensis]GKZ43337.1 geranylgeranyl pyrophosphate synthase [Aspergillus brasiliensis]
MMFGWWLTEVDELRNLHVGQAMDLYWTRFGYPPSITEYLEMNRLSFAENLDEGKLSLPLIHLLTLSPHAALIENIQHERARNGKLPADLKQLILNEMRNQKIPEETLVSLEAKVHRHLERVEVSTGIKNFTFRFLLDRLKGM